MTAALFYLACTALAGLGLGLGNALARRARRQLDADHQRGRILRGRA